jgi:ArsR family transcriptional regulator, arsenate/arsenite/antimonite-responsive transcriptional repressor
VPQAPAVVVQSGREASQTRDLLRRKVRDTSRGSPRSSPAQNTLAQDDIKLHHYPARYRLDIDLYFCNYRNMAAVSAKKSTEQVARYADMFSAMGTEPRLRIMQLLLSAHPEGLVVGDIQEELDIPNSTLSHHLDKLRNEGLVSVQRESTFLRYSANTESLQELLQFLYAECCTRNKALRPQDVIQICK